MGTHNVYLGYTFKEIDMHKNKILRNIIVLSLIVVVVVLLMTVLDKSTLKMTKAYYTLSNKPSRSDAQFKIPTGRVDLNSDGTKSISFEVIVNELDSLTNVDEEDSEGAEGEDETQSNTE